MAECRRVEIRPNVLKEYVDYLSRPESQAALLHEIVYENGYVMAPMLRRAFDRTTAELAVRYAGEGAQMSSSGMLKLNQSIPGTRMMPRYGRQRVHVQDVDKMQPRRVSIAFVQCRGGQSGQRCGFGLFGNLHP